MNDSVYIALVGFLAAIAGGVIQAWAHRNFDAKRIERQGRTDAYLSYLNAISELSYVQTKSERAKADSKVADARGKMAISGSPAVIRAMVASFDFGNDLYSTHARAAHAKVISAMRVDCLAVPGRSEPDDLVTMLYGRSSAIGGRHSGPNAQAESSLPLWYPLANATDEEIATWLKADDPPYEAMRDALPWLTSEDQLDAWLNGVRYAEKYGSTELFGNVAILPLPPRRRAGRKVK